MDMRVPVYVLDGIARFVVSPCCHEPLHSTGEEPWVKCVQCHLQYDFDDLAAKVARESPGAGEGVLSPAEDEEAGG